MHHWSIAMIDIPAEVVGIIIYLMPGFITAWIFYGLTAHRRLSPFERTVQALIFTALVRALVLPLRGFLIAVGKLAPFTIGTWTTNVEFVSSVLIAIVLGHFVAFAANANSYHQRLYEWGITSRTSFPSEWYSTFTRCRQYITLHLVGQRRLMGWPYEWPDHPDAGHFVIQEPTWILDDNTEVPILTDEFILIPATSVEMVEILRYRKETDRHREKIEKDTRILVDLQRATPKHKEDIMNPEDEE
jgi:hypothetical protein